MEIHVLTPSDVGKYILYIPTGEVGRIKEIKWNIVWVVYNCNNNRDEYTNYTWALTKIEDLKFID